MPCWGRCWPCSCRREGGRRAAPARACWTTRRGRGGGVSLRDLVGFLVRAAGPPPQPPRQERRGVVPRAGVPRADRLAHDDLPGDELDRLVLGEDSRRAHPMVLLDGEPAPREEIAHGESPAGHSSVVVEARQRRPSGTPPAGGPGAITPPQAPPRPKT